MDVILGGGGAHFYQREDGQDLLAKAREKGYQVALDSSDLDNITSGKVLGLFADANMAYTIDRRSDPTLNKTQPSLAEMTRKALELLSNENGFFAMFEGALVDVAEHSNDPATAVHELLGYSETFAVVLEFAKKHGNTIIISTSDHETGGLSLGMQNDFGPGQYPDYAYYPQNLAAYNASCLVMAQRMLAGQDIRTTVATATGINLTDAEVTNIQAFLPGNDASEIAGVIGKAISIRSLIGWTSHGHTGVDVNLYIYGLPIDYEFPGGNLENTEIATLIADLLDLDLDEMTGQVKTFPTNISNTDAKARRSPNGHHLL